MPKTDDLSATMEKSDILDHLRNLGEMGPEGSSFDPLIEVFAGLARDAADEIATLRAAQHTPADAPAPPPVLTRKSLARNLAMLDGIRLLEIKSSVGPEADANNWREYLGRADDLLSMLSIDAVDAPQDDPASPLDDVRREAFSKCAEIAKHQRRNSPPGPARQASRFIEDAIRAAAAADPVRGEGGK